ncbi:amino acid adenylation domain-containing protein [Streptomyces sp. ADMS]|uniref:amino acid adenylation domain-containing protein n=1 Tax=Streptomyces sp. ADMS TaxID=3071415 RepID=UPI00296E6D97|nr:amino acid adenylation domain-containing protein [Streptomyces sp. ADMS]MDW4909135.1 amino acid adenylation domain-containing protein [Streptomyces sp. ADMS]
MTQVTPEVPEFTHGRLIHESVAWHAQHHPERIAVRHGDVQVTYRELHLASDDHAADLHAAGVGSGSRIPVLMSRTPRFVAVILGILKCGAAYAALDPSWPENRLHSIIEQLEPPVLAAEAPLNLGVPHWPGAHSSIGDAVRRGRRAPGVVCDSDAAAAVFFTSGSTGTPKGVVSPHRAAVRLFQPDSFADLGAGHTMAGVNSLYWDVMTLEVVGPLVSGGTVALMTDEYLLPAGLAALVREQGVDSMWLTSSLFNMFVDEDLACFDGLRQLLIGGERVSQHHIRKFLRRHPSVLLLNGYGPAEACVFATTHPVTLADTDRPDGVPIGRVVPRTEVHLLDGDTRCRAGETGEICVAGAGLANEYLGNPAETAARFVTVELDGVPTRVYRTGDLGVQTPDGVLHYRGRIDRQVKIRGYRIEPLEIENACLALPSVERAVAVPVHDEDGALSRMALFYVQRTGIESLAEEEIRAQLATALPAHCMPAELRELAAIPLTPNGKVDTQVLLATVSRAPVQVESAHGSHRDIVVEEFTRILGREAAPDVPFASLGGTSLDVLRLCTRVVARTGLQISASAFMRTPTLNGLLAVAESASTLPECHSAVNTGQPDRIVLDGIQAGFCLLHEMDPDNPTAICHAAWTIEGALELPLLEAALNDVHHRHEGLRAAYRVDDDPVAVLPGPLDGIRLETVTAADFDTALRRPLRIEDGEVWRCVYGEPGLLGLAVHHVSFDGWSQGLLIADLKHAYQARSCGLAPEFAETAPGLRRLAEEADALRSPDEEVAQLRYWTSALAGLPDLDFPPPLDETERPLSFTIEADTVAALRELAQGVGGTVFLPLLACYGAALTQVLGQQDFGIGVPLARRFGQEAVRAVSCLVDTLCLRLPTLDGCGTPKEALDAVRPVVEAAFAHQGIRFADVVRELRPPRTGRNPLYQTLFAYQGNEVTPLELPGCTAEPYPLASESAINELVCEIWPLPSGGLRVDLSHQGHRVGRDVVERVARVYQAVLVGNRRELSCRTL